VIGITVSHYKCNVFVGGRYKSLTLQVERVCRHCDIPTTECDNAFYPWWHVFPNDVQALVKAHDHVGLKAISQHHVCNAFYNNPKLNIGLNP
jgi:hypothetical protein